MDSSFDKIRQNNCKLYIHKSFRNNILEQTLLAGEGQLQEHYQLTTIPSSQFSRVYKFTVSFNGVERVVYFKQYLYRSAWDFIKHLVRASRAKRAFKAMLMLAENGFETPTLIAMGECKSGLFYTRNFLVTLEVEDAKQIYQFIPESLEDLTKEQLRLKRELIRAFGRTIGRMHAKGIFHGDLRLGNVLARKEEERWWFFLIDNERTKKFRRLPGRLWLKNLVEVNMLQSPCLTNSDRMRFFREYQAENGKSKKQKTALTKKIIKRTNQRLSKKRDVRRELKKRLRTGKRYLRIKADGHLAVFDKGFCQGAEPIDFIEQIDALMDGGQILKNGSTCYVSRVTWNGEDVVVKRYNHKGFIHSLRHTIKKSRARRGWLHGHRLGMLNIATPRPLAYVEECKGLLLWKSYLMTEYIQGQNLHYFLRDDNTTEDERSRAIEQISELLNKLGKCRISHGDLKHTNILITDNGPVLTDLDSMRKHKYKWLYKVYHAKDTARLSFMNKA